MTDIPVTADPNKEPGSDDLLSEEAKLRLNEAREQYDGIAPVYRDEEPTTSRRS